MPDMIAFLPATWTCSFGNSAGSAPSRTVGAKPLKFNGTLHLRGEQRARSESPRKSRGSVTHRQLRCNMTKCPQGMRVLPTAGPCASGQRRWYTGLPSSSAFAQLATATSRVAVLAYTMPIWAALFAYPILGERLNVICAISLLLCAAGLTVLIYPLLGSSDLIGLVLALATAVSWAAGTVYLKWAQIDADPMAISAWQLVVALVVTFTGALTFEGSL